MSVVLYRFGDGWVDLKPRLVAKTRRDEAVLWLSASGSTQFFALVDGNLTRTRESPSNVHAGDGRLLLVDEPWFATACGCGDRRGYRSTPPLLVASVDGPDDVKSLLDDAYGRVGELTGTAHSTEPMAAGHPPEPCGAVYCMRITPRLIEAGQ